MVTYLNFRVNNNLHWAAMVLLHVKHGDESQFLYETSTSTPIATLIDELLNVYNGRLKIYRIIAEMEELEKHGTLLPPDMMGLTEEQVGELKLRDEQGKIRRSSFMNFLSIQGFLRISKWWSSRNYVYLWDHLTPNNVANHQVKELSSYETRNFVALNIHEMEEIVCSLVQSQL